MFRPARIMFRPPAKHKRSRLLYQRVRALAGQGGHKKESPMLGVALICFVGLFAFGNTLLGWHDPQGQVQMGLFMAFLFGIVCGYRARA
jgi:hypothetical protein